MAILHVPNQSFFTTEHCVQSTAYVGKTEQKAIVKASRIDLKMDFTAMSQSLSCYIMLEIYEPTTNFHFVFYDEVFPNFLWKYFMICRIFSFCNCHSTFRFASNEKILKLNYCRHASLVSLEIFQLLLEAKLWCFGASARGNDLESLSIFMWFFCDSQLRYHSSRLCSKLGKPF